MAKKYVKVKCDAKDLYDSSLKSSLVKMMTACVTNAIEKKSKGKLTTKIKSRDGFTLTATLAPLKADDKDKPTKLDAKVSIIVLGIGTKDRAFIGSKGGSLDGFGSKVKRAAGELTITIMEAFMPKVIQTILKL